MNQCEDCGKELADDKVVWVRTEPAGKRKDWNKPQCADCYSVERPGREPIFIGEDK